MQMIADLHTHTLCATHAYNTFTEMAAAAKEIGYCALAVTDHAPAMPDSPHAWHFQNWSAMPREIGGVVMLYGAEANVMDTKGGLDLSESQLKAQDWVVASIHSSCVPGLLTRREANRLWLAVAENPYVDTIGHSEGIRPKSQGRGAERQLVQCPQRRHPQYARPAAGLPCQRLSYFSGQ